MKGVIIIGTEACSNLRSMPMNSVIIGNFAYRDATQVPSNHFFIDGAINAIITDPFWPEAIPIAQREALLCGWPSAIASLAEQFGFDTGAARSATAEILRDIQL